MPERNANNETRDTRLRSLENNPDQSQRELARELGISLGIVNYCLKALLDMGCIKTGNFKNSHNKRACIYKLTPAGIAAKSRAIKHFLKHKQAGYERLAGEIKQLQRGVEQSNVGRSG